MTFEEWFIAQRGQRPGPSAVSDYDLAVAVSEGLNADWQLRGRREYDDAREVALLAWQAAQKGDVTP